MADVAFAPTWQRKRSPRAIRLLVLGFALVILAIAAGPRLIVDWGDLTCPDGYGARPVGIADWAVQCQANDGPASWPRSVPTRRYVGLFLTNVSARVFDADLIVGNVHGPALDVPVR